MLRSDDVYLPDFVYEGGGGVMSEFVHNYIQTLVYSAVFCFLAMALTPEGSGKKAVGIACAAAMMIAVISPVVTIDLSDYSKMLTEYKLKAEEYADSGRENSENLNRLYIQDKCQAYILDKAEEIGAYISEVTVTAEWSIDGYWYPVSCEIRYDSTDGQRAELETLIGTQLGISKDEQKWCKTNEQ